MVFDLAGSTALEQTYSVMLWEATVPPEAAGRHLGQKQAGSMTWQLLWRSQQGKDSGFAQFVRSRRK